MNRMFPAGGTILFEFQTARIVTTVLFGRVIPLFAVAALQRNDRADIFLFSSHFLPYFQITR
jgi:hypothetical protein